MQITSRLKQKDLFITQLENGDSFVWRLLTLEEFRAYSALAQQGALSSIELWYSIFETCYIGNIDLLPDSYPVGIFLSIGQFIFEMSADTADNLIDLIDAKRQYYIPNSIQNIVRLVVMAAFNYKPADLEKFSIQQLIDLFIEAEHILTLKYPGYSILDTSTLVSPEEYEKLVNKQQDKIDFEADNRAIRSHGLQHAHPTEAHPAELAAIARRYRNLQGG